MVRGTYDVSLGRILILHTRAYLAAAILSCVVASSANAQQAPSPELQQLNAIVVSPAFRSYLDQAVVAVEQAPLKAKCAQPKVTGVRGFVPVATLVMNGGAMTSGMWVTVVTIDRCGTPGVRRILSRVEGGPNALTPSGLLPGDFRGDLRLETDITKAMTQGVLNFSKCADAASFAVVDIKTQGEPTAQGWSEAWTTEACGKTVTGVVDYKRVPAGGTDYAARDFKLQ